MMASNTKKRIHGSSDDEKGQDYYKAECQSPVKPKSEIVNDLPNNSNRRLQKLENCISKVRATLRLGMNKSPAPVSELALIYAVGCARTLLKIDHELLLRHWEILSVDEKGKPAIPPITNAEFAKLHYRMRRYYLLGDSFFKMFSEQYQPGCWEAWLREGGWARIMRVLILTLPLMVSRIIPKFAHLPFSEAIDDVKDQFNWRNVLEQSEHGRLAGFHVFKMLCSACNEHSSDFFNFDDQISFNFLLKNFNLEKTK